MELLEFLQQGGLADAAIAEEHQQPMLFWLLVRQVPLKGGDQLCPVGEHLQGGRPLLLLGWPLDRHGAGR
jgi:hypothetical protein